MVELQKETPLLATERDIVQRLNQKTYGEWTWKVTNVDIKEHTVICTGDLQVRDDSGNKSLRSGIGVSEGKDKAEVIHEAELKALASAISRFYPTAEEETPVQEPVQEAMVIAEPAPFEPPKIVSEPAPVVPEQVVSEPAPVIQQVEKPQPQTKISVPQTSMERASELKRSYGLRTQTEFLMFAQVWKPDIPSFNSITGEMIDQLHDYVMKYPERFKQFEK